jgi:uncharacterized membrane protein
MRLFGHPVHAVLVAFPLALLGLAPLCDLASRFHLIGGAQLGGYFCQVVGLIGGGLAVLAGFADFVRFVDPRSATAKVALTHAGVALAMLTLYGLAFALRGGRTAEPGTAVLALELLGAVLLSITGWFGGHLVFHHRVGVDTAKEGD